MKEIRPVVSDINATVDIPGSKSITHRAVIASALAHGESQLRNYLECEDTLYTINALRELGADISAQKNHLKVRGNGGAFRLPARKDFYLGNSGTSFRLLLSVAALGQGEIFMSGASRMLSRPIGQLVSALKQAGVEAACVDKEDYPPVLIRAKGIRGGKVSVRGDQSSQFISSLLLSAPYADNDIEIRVRGELVSKPYVDITIDIMDRFGVSVMRDGYARFIIPSGQVYRSAEFTVQGDASSASYFWSAAAVTGGTITTKNIEPYRTRQGDMKFLDLLERMGCSVKKASDRVIVQGGRLSGIDVDMSSIPDMVPSMAVVALFCHGRTSIRNVGHLRLKESDRLHAIALEWNRLGGRVEEIDDGLIIQGGAALTGTEVTPHDDHRLAMSLAVAGLRVPGIKISDENCVNKSFPKFWELMELLYLK